MNGENRVKWWGHIKIGLFLAPWAVLAVYYSQGLMPDSYWMKVASIRVMDAKAGEDHDMIVDQIVKRPVIADWTTSVRKVEKDGTFVTYCNASGRDSYTPRTRLPEHLTMTWWLSGQRCILPVGSYILTTRWVLNIVGGTDRIVQASSNEFRVTPGPISIPDGFYGSERGDYTPPSIKAD